MKRLIMGLVFLTGVIALSSDYATAQTSSESNSSSTQASAQVSKRGSTKKQARVSRATSSKARRACLAGAKKLVSKASPKKPAATPSIPQEPLPAPPTFAKPSPFVSLTPVFPWWMHQMFGAILGGMTVFWILAMTRLFSKEQRIKVSEPTSVVEEAIPPPAIAEPVIDQEPANIEYPGLVLGLRP